MGGIVTVTINPSIDTNSRISHVMAEHKLRCSAPSHEPGGGGINVSRAIRRLGGESLALFPSGRHFGDMLTGLLEQDGVSYRATAISDETRENFIILEEASGRQFRFGMPGPSIREKEWQSLIYELDSVDFAPEYVIGSGSLPPGVPDDFYARLAKKAADVGAKCIIDTSGKALKCALDLKVYLIKPNINELRVLMGQDIMEEQNIEDCARVLIEKGKAEIIVVSLGAAGALLVTGETCMRIHAPTVRIVSKVGAGDSMVAGMVISLMRGFTVVDAVRFGVAAGAAAVMAPGTELCRKDDTERLYERMHT